MKPKILLLLPFMALAFASCHDELEETVYSNLTDDTAFTSVENAQAAVDAMYAPLHQIYRDPMFQASDGVTDVCFDKGVSAFEVLNDEAIRTSSHLTTCWDNFFQVTSRANIVIDRVGAMDDALFTDADKGQMIAEAHFMRAYAYMQLSDLFYRVPLVLSSDIDVKENLPLASIDEIEDAIETDLKAAMTLPEKYDSRDDGGRPTLGSVRGFLVRLYMRQAGRLRQNGGDDQAKWKQALDAVNEVLAMEGSVYNLQPNVWDVFDPNSDATLYNNELMFTIRAKESISSAAWDLGMMFTNWDYDMGWNLFLVPLQQFWSFDPTDERRSVMIVSEFPNVYNSADNPAAASYYYAPLSLAEVATMSKSNLDGSGNLKPGETYGTIGELSTVFTRKYEYHNSFKYTYRTQNNMPVMRFADMILCKAEILNEINGPSQTALDLINRIRERAFHNTDHNLSLADFSTKEALRSGICDERAKELGMECVRRVDLIRMGLWKDRMEKYFAGIKEIAQMRERNENKPSGYYDSDWRVYPTDLTENDIRRYMPIPKRETDYNPELLDARNF